MSAPIRLDLPVDDLLVGWIRADGVRVKPAPDGLGAELDTLLANSSAWGLDDEVRVAVRDLLRGHGYKPSGRGKPANEFLARVAAAGEFPRINNVVDINNLMSLQTGWPISVLDYDRVGGGDVVVRLGEPGEAFAFNVSGHEIGVGGLVSVATPGGPALANPVKDSMQAKLDDSTDRVLGVIYTSRVVTDEKTLADAAARFGELLAEYADATAIRSGVEAASV